MKLLNFICSEDRAEASRAVLQTICDRAREGVSGQILIVPEQFSHEAERELCKLGGDSISRYAEVLSFSRLAGRVFSVYGGVSEEYLDNGGRFLTAFKAAEQVRSQLKFYASAGSRPDFLQQLCAVMEEFLADCLTPDDLKKAADSQQGQFAQKLTELAILYESYLSVCKTGRNDPVTRLFRLEELLRSEDFAADHIFYIDGFSDFTAIELKIADALICRSAEVTVSLRLGSPNKAIFRACADTKKQLTRCAANSNTPVTVKNLPISAERTDAVSFAIAHLFDAHTEIFDGVPTGVRLHRADSPAGECLYALGRVRELTGQGYRLRDIGIALCDAPLYEQELREILRKTEIAAYFAGNEPLLQQPAAAALMAALRAQERFLYDDVMTFVKSSISPLTADEADALEQYAFRWNIVGSKWQKPWTMHPDGLGVAADENSSRRLCELNALRERVIEPLSGLQKRLRQAHDTAQMLTAVADWMEKTEFCEHLQALSETQELQKSQQTRQLYDILLDAMEQMYRIMGDSVLSPEVFLQVFEMLLSQYAVGTIPSALDAVTVGKITDFRRKTTKVMIVLGAEEGKLPAFSAAVGLLTDEERKKLLALGLQLAPEQADLLEREMGGIHAAFSAPTDSLELCCSGESVSFLFSKLQTLFPQLECSDPARCPYVTDACAAAAAYLAGGERLPQDAQLAAAAQMLQQHTQYDFLPLSRQTVSQLYGDTVRLSASKIDRFAGCRLAYFLEYGLHAEPWKQAKVEASIFGTFVHEVLEHTVNEVNRLGGFSSVSEQEISEIVLRQAQLFTEQKLPDIAQTGERFAYLFRRNMQEVLLIAKDVARELRLSEFEARDTELRFADRDGQLPPVRIETKNGACLIVGSVDRVDLYFDGTQTYCRVIDYKTGKKDFDFADILIGKGLQMLIYLFALKQLGQQRYGQKLIPAGVMYVPARTQWQTTLGADADSAAAGHTKAHRRKGLVLDDAQILSAMEKQQEPEYLPCVMKKDGLSGNMASREQLSQLDDFVTDKVAEMTDAILDGAVEPNPVFRGPKENVCQYCDYQAVCHRDLGKIRQRVIKRIPEKDFWDAVKGGGELG